MAFGLFKKQVPEPAAPAAEAKAPQAPAAAGSAEGDSASAILELLELELGAMIRQLERAAGARIGGALELADHRAQLEFQQFQDFPGRIGISGREGLGIGRRRSLRGRHRRSHVRLTLPK